MKNYFEISFFKRIARCNYILLAVYLAISVTAHAVANRLVLIHGYPIISAGFIYMAVFVLTDIFASFNTQKFVIFMICLEAFFNLFFIGCTNFITHMPYPNYFHEAQADNTVFNPIVILYIANLGGTFIAAVVDLFIFYYLYLKRRWIFLWRHFHHPLLLSRATLT